MTLIYIKFIVSAALLTAFYWVVLRQKASYMFNRIYLLSLPVVCALMSVLSFGVLTSSASANDSGTNASAMLLSSTSGVSSEGTVGQYAYDRTVVPLSQAQVTEPAWSISDVDWAMVLSYLVPVISILLVVLALFYVGRLLFIKSLMVAEKTIEGYDVIRSSSVKTPFSFAKTIFCPVDLDKCSEDFIMSHEKAHIVHRHYVDVWIMEFFTRVFWFNPVIWLCRSELRNVHEFQADHDVIAAGANVRSYQSTLLEMVLNENCPVVNGFSHSFIRRRFVEMKQSAAGSLGNIGKCGMVAWVAALFCIFTFEECAPKPQDKMASLDLETPQKFVLEGTVDSGIADSCYLIYIGDEYFHIAGDSDHPCKDSAYACVPVVDKKFHFEMDLTRVTAARIQCIFPGGEICTASIATFFVPGETYFLHVHNGFYSDSYSQGYASKIKRGVEALRRATNWDSPHMPHFDCPAWIDPQHDASNYAETHIKDVYFDKEQTVVRIVNENHLGTFQLSDQFLLKDDKGNKYKFIKPLTGTVTGNNNKEARAYGVYLAFEPMPDDVEKFDLCVNINGEGMPMIGNVHQSINNGKQFSIDITASEGINDTGYLIDVYMQGSRVNVADLKNDANRHCSYELRLDEICEAEVRATFADGSICTAYVPMPFVPGEHAELTVLNGTFRLDGTGFYHEWNQAHDAINNFVRYSSGDEVHDKLLAFLKDNASKPGVAICFLMRTRDYLSIDELFDAFPDEIKNIGMVKEKYDNYIRSKNYFEERERQKQEAQKYTLPGMKFKDFAVEYNGKTTRLSDYVGRGKYVLVDFWASWCQPCRGEIPNLIDVYNKYKGDKFEVVGIATWDEPEATLNAIKEEGIEYPQIINAQKIGSDAYGVLGIPEIILFGPDGTILKRDLRGRSIEMAVREALGK